MYTGGYIPPQEKEDTLRASARGVPQPPPGFVKQKHVSLKTENIQKGYIRVLFTFSGVLLSIKDLVKGGDISKE